MLVVGEGLADASADTSASADVRLRGWRSLEPVLRLLSATIIIGEISGAVIGVLGVRVAMRILFVTSDDTVKGVISDDGFEIGRFTLSDTIGLVIVTALIGIIA